MEISAFLEHDEKDTQNVKQVKALYKALREKDRETIARVLTDDPVWNVSPGFPDGGVYKGMAEILGSFYAKLRNRFRSFSAVPETFIDGGDVVVVLGFYKFERQEEENSFRFVRFAHTWGINKDGRIRGVWQVADSAQFLSFDELEA
ncbi:nuclear transport factor 2 family protein [Azotosporobacter soli]|uniref:nuclear transport factor 2 family protein n=1 Tax=Azotosporobacter soli TaxID=3055040 RepID=UPI0031FEED6B